jgi:hypothetical protein
MTLVKSLILGAVFGIATLGVASAQSSGLYVLHSKATATCPALDWHVVVDVTSTGDNLSGVIGWDDMKHIASVSGTLNPNTRYFEMKATEVGGDKRTAKIDGQLRLDGWMTANIDGAGISCKSVVIPYYVPPAGGSN